VTVVEEEEGGKAHGDRDRDEEGREAE